MSEARHRNDLIPTHDPDSNPEEKGIPCKADSKNAHRARGGPGGRNVLERLAALHRVEDETIDQFTDGETEDNIGKVMNADENGGSDDGGHHKGKELGMMGPVEPNNAAEKPGPSHMKGRAGIPFGGGEVGE